MVDIKAILCLFWLSSLDADSSATILIKVEINQALFHECLRFGVMTRIKMSVFVCHLLLNNMIEYLKQAKSIK